MPVLKVALNFRIGTISSHLSSLLLVSQQAWFSFFLFSLSQTGRCKASTIIISSSSSSALPLQIKPFIHRQLKVVLVVRLANVSGLWLSALGWLIALLLINFRLKSFASVQFGCLAEPANSCGDGCGDGAGWLAGRQLMVLSFVLPSQSKLLADLCRSGASVPHTLRINPSKFEFNFH